MRLAAEPVNGVERRQTEAYFRRVASEPRSSPKSRNARLVKVQRDAVGLLVSDAYFRAARTRINVCRQGCRTGWRPGYDGSAL